MKRDRVASDARHLSPCQRFFYLFRAEPVTATRTGARGCISALSEYPLFILVTPVTSNKALYCCILAGRKRPIRVIPAGIQNGGTHGAEDGSV